MEDLKASNIAHFYLGAKVMTEFGDFYTLTPSNIPSNWNDVDWLYGKLCLFPLSYLDSMDGNKLKDQYSGLLYRGSNPQNKQETPRSIIFLLRNYFNVFNLPESEYIDASKLPVNPYLKP